MKLLPTTKLTTQLLQQDETAASMSIWKLETVVHGRRADFYLYRQGKHFDLYLAAPMIVRLGQRNSLQEIVDLYNTCIDNSKLNSIKQMVGIVRGPSYADI